MGWEAIMIIILRMPLPTGKVKGARKHRDHLWKQKTKTRGKGNEPCSKKELLFSNSMPKPTIYIKSGLSIIL